MSSSRKLGEWGEARAAQYLEEKGYAILERNAYSRYGEIDLVARQGDQIVFVEVKTRRSHSFGDPEQAVDARKQAHLVSAALAYLQANPDMDLPWRIDVIAIRRLPGEDRLEIVHFENAVQEGGAWS